MERKRGRLQEGGLEGIWVLHMEAGDAASYLADLWEGLKNKVFFNHFAFLIPSFLPSLHKKVLSKHDES